MGCPNFFYASEVVKKVKEIWEIGGPGYSTVPLFAGTFPVEWIIQNWIDFLVIQNYIYFSLNK